MTRSFATGLACIECGASAPLDYVLECPGCRGLLELQYDWTALVSVLSPKTDSRAGRPSGQER